MAKSKFPVTYALGRRDRFDPKLAPLGVVKVGKNLRVRKDGRLVMRRGYAPLPMTTRNGTLRAFDIFEYRGRLCAFGSDTGDDFPTDLFEYVGLADAGWRATDRFGQRVMLNPMTNLREVAGIPQPHEGVQRIDGAIGDGYVCLVYRPQNGVSAFALVVDVATDQTVHFEDLVTGGAFAAGSIGLLRCVHTNGAFYVASVLSSSVRIARFVVGTSSRFATFADPAPLGAAITGMDLCAVSNDTNARVGVTWARSDGEYEAIVYDDSGNGIAAISVSDDVHHVAIEADEADNTINLLAMQEAGANYEATLRTYNFAGSLLDGPTVLGTASTVATATAFLARLPAQTGFAEHVAVVVNTDVAAAEIYFVNVDTHGVTDSVTVQHAICQGRPVAAQSAVQPAAILLPGIVAPDMTTLDDATNALFYVTPDVAHMTARDYARGRGTSAVNLSRDTSTGKVCWVALRDPGIDAAMPVVTVVDLFSSARRQTANYGGLLYVAGATPTVYDGRINGELGFAEVPGISDAVASGGGQLAESADYSYVFNWEYVLADGSVEQGPVTAPFAASTGAGQTRITVTVTAPHTVRLAAGDALFGASVVGVLSRTTWDAVTRTPGSTYRRCHTEGMRLGMIDYGESRTIIDVMSDAELATQGAIYTQAERGALSGPLEHNAPRACSYITATEARLLTGGLARDCDVQISKAAFYGEPFSFSENSAFSGLASGPVLGVQSLDQARLIFTRDTILSLTGVGPDDIGGGVLEPPVEIPTPFGLYNPWSFLKGPDGLWFQLGDSKLFRIPRGGGAPEWVGIDVEDTLLQFPNITGACKHQADNVAVFACNATVADTRILVFEFRTQMWLLDELPGDPANITAICPYEDGFALIREGVVHFNRPINFGLDSVDGVTPLFIATELTTQPLYPFGLGGYGQISELLVTGEALGNSQLSTRVSYDDGQTWTTLEPFDFPDAGGETFQRKLALPQDITSSLVVEFAVAESPTAPEAGEGLVITQLDLLVEPEDGLRELSAEHQA